MAPAPAETVEAPVAEAAAGDVAAEEVDESAPDTMDELFSLKPDTLELVTELDEESEDDEDLDDPKGGRKKKKRRRYVEMEYDPDKDVMIVKRKRKRPTQEWGEGWEEEW